ncbi:MAG TPA: hypothetical protein VGN52_11470 [Burkholderiales bacterium]
MLVEGKPDIVVAFAGGKGTKNMMAQTREAGVRLFVVFDSCAKLTDSQGIVREIFGASN